MNAKVSTLTWLAGALLALAAIGCSAEAPSQQLLPLIAQDKDGRDRGLAGVYDPATQQVWFVSSMVEGAIELAWAQPETQDPRVVLMQGTLSSEVLTDTNEASVYKPMSVADTVRVCVVDGETRRWMVSDLRVGSAEEMPLLTEEFAPAVLEMDCYVFNGNVHCTEVIDVVG
jgi:hypothetical protein